MPPRRKTEELNQQPRRKSRRIAQHKRPREEASDDDHDDLDRSTLARRSKDHRMTADDQEEDDSDIRSFKIPFNDKAIICMHHTHGEKEAPPRLVFTHGAGGGIANPATKDFAMGFGEQAPVVCFQGTMNLKNRVKTFHAVLDHVGATTAFGGRSMGARAAVITAQETQAKPKALVLVSYPLISGNNGETRDQILYDSSENLDVLFISGSNDAMCPLTHLDEVRRKMSSRSWMVEVVGADHGMSLKDKKSVEAMRRRTGALAAEWLLHRDGEKLYCRIQWDSESGQITGGEWQVGAE